MRLNLLIIALFFGFEANCQIHPYGTSTNQTYIGGTLKLQDARDAGFGTWSSLNTGIATVGSKSGTVTGVSQGFDTIVYTRTGVHDTLSIYVATSDSSGYYFESASAFTPFKILCLRDCDGATNLSLWSGATLATAGSGKVFGNVYTTTYNSITDCYQIFFNGVYTGIGINYQITIPFSKIKDIGGFAPDANRLTTLAYIMSNGF